MKNFGFGEALKLTGADSGGIFVGGSRGEEALVGIHGGRPVKWVLSYKNPT